jgi:AraC family L-rhamnose operon regulatory protein RhaS
MQHRHARASSRPPAQTAQVAQAEYFSSYRARCWRAEQPLAVLHQWYEAGDDTGAYRHVDFYALYVVRAGRGIHVINDHPYPIRRGDVYITPPGSVVSYRDYRRLQAEVFCFQAQLFTDEELDALSELPGFQHLFIRGERALEPVVADTHTLARATQLHLTPARYQDVDALVDDALAEMQHNEVVSPVLVRGLLFRLLVYLARAALTSSLASSHLSKMTAERSSGMSQALADIVYMCESRFDEDLSVPQLAALMFMSPAHFSELFTREVGMPPATYLRHLRLEHAQMLLRTSAYSITEIAQRCGFGDSAQLARAFRAALDMTPRAYRQRFRA